MSKRIFFICVNLFFFYAEMHAQDVETIGKLKPVAIAGGASVRTLFYSAKGIENRRKPFSYVLTGSPVLSIYGVTIPFYFVYSEQERSFRQPFNQFGMSPYYKWITVHAGYRNLTYSPYTLGGHTMLGAGVDLNPGIFRFGFMYGRLNRATVVDTTSGSFNPYSYTRNGYAARFGIAKGNNFLDFSILKGKDDASSVGDVSKISTRVTPAENIVFGLGGATSFKGFSVEGDVGLSLYTNNTQSSIKSLDSLPRTLTQTLGKFIAINGTTEFYSACSFGIGYRIKDVSIKLKYKRVDPDFKSMGTYFFNNDLENVTITPSFSMLNKKIQFSGSLGLQHDNLQNQKQSTSKRVIGSANISAALTDNLGVDASYTNFTTNQKPGRVFVDNSFLVTQTTKSIGVTPRYMITGTDINHVFLASLNYTDLVDLNSTTAASNNLNSTIMFFNYQIVLVPKNLTLYMNINATKLNMAMGTTSNSGITLGGNKTLRDNKLSIGLTVSLINSTTANRKSVLMNDGLQCSYAVSKHHSFSMTMNYIGNYAKSSTSENPSFNEFRGEIAYNVSF